MVGIVTPHFQVIIYRYDGEIVLNGETKPKFRWRAGTSRVHGLQNPEG